MVTDSTAKWVAEVFVLAITAPIHAFLPAWLLQLTFRWRMKAPLRYWRAYGACVFGAWIMCAPSLLGALLGHVLQSEAIALALTIPTCILMLSVFFGRYLNDSNGKPIGGRNGFLLIVLNAGIGLSIILIGIIIGLVVLFVGLQGLRR